jgi:hypothetical protein
MWRRKKVSEEYCVEKRDCSLGEDLTYKIPEDILSKIPEYFWSALAGELVSVFGPHALEKVDDSYNLYFLTGTTGWNAALRMTCRKLDMDWLYEYYNNLQWWESDMFDGEFEDLIISKFVEAEDIDNWPEVPTEEQERHASTYYSWLTGSITFDEEPEIAE